MNLTRTEADLRAAIQALEIRQAEDAQQLKLQLMRSYDHIQPINIIKRTLEEVGSSRELTSQIMLSTLGMALGHLSSIIYLQTPPHMARKKLGAALLFGLSGWVANNPRMVHSVMEGVFRWAQARHHAQEAALPESVEKALDES